MMRGAGLIGVKLLATPAGHYRELNIVRPITNPA